MMAVLLKINKLLQNFKQLIRADAPEMVCHSPDSKPPGRAICKNTRVFPVPERENYLANKGFPFNRSFFGITNIGLVKSTIPPWRDCS
jgi:hypothetical protein